MREFLLDRTAISQLIDFGDLPVFDATTYPLILVVERSECADENVVYVTTIESLELERLDQLIDGNKQAIYQKNLNTQEWNLGDVAARKLLMGLQEENSSLEEFVGGSSQMGVKTGLNEAFIIDSPTREELLRKEPHAATVILPLCTGREVRRYKLEWSHHYLIYTFHGIDIEQYPAIHEHLLPYREKLEERATQQQWYELQQPQEAYKDQFLRSKIIMPDLAERGRFYLDRVGMFTTNTAYFLPTDDLYLLAILNSRLTTFCLENTSATFRGGYLRMFGQYVEKLPIYKAEFPSPADERERLLEKGQKLYVRYCQKDDLACVTGFVEHELAQERSDVVHDLLAFLAPEMIAMHKKKQQVTEDFWLDLEGVADPGTYDVLRNKGKWEATLWKAEACRPFVDEESCSTRHLNESLGWNEEAFKAFVKVLVRSVPNLSDLVRVYRKYHSRYYELVGRISKTDYLIDQIVYQLYGLTEEEIGIVESDI